MLILLRLQGQQEETETAQRVGDNLCQSVHQQDLVPGGPQSGLYGEATLESHTGGQTGDHGTLHLEPGGLDAPADAPDCRFGQRHPHPDSLSRWC